MKKSHILLVGAIAAFTSCSQNEKFRKVQYPDNEIRAKVESLMKQMTLEEKIGQMNQYSGDAQATGPIVKDTAKLTQIRAGKIGSMLNVVDVEQTRRYQEVALESRLGIPLLFGQDVIHGFRTIFPIPLGEAASFDLQEIENGARWAATEASASGIHWTFAPMVDVSWDARWGRVMEGAGEDPYYGARVAEARVKGFQGDDLSADNTILACAKHWAAYGAPIAGKDYNSVDMTTGHFYNFYMAPYKAAKDAGVATFMNAFNDFNNIPCSANEFLLRKLLKGDWQFDGFVVSDWGSIGEMVDHRYAENKEDAACKSVHAGSDMDMESRSYINNLANLVRSGKVDESYVDDAVRRILIKKYELGLFEDPFKYCDAERQKNTVLSPEIRQASRTMAKKSIVLLKNENSTLPVANSTKKVAVIGALADSKEDMSGFWANERVIPEMVTVKEAFEKRGYQVDYCPGYDLQTKEVNQQMQALRAARNADVVIVAVGERWFESGEAKSRGDIEVNASQQKLVTELKKAGKPVITLVMGGRPMIFNEIRENSDAILFTWWLGTEAGNAIADVICGDYNPSAKLPMTFPAHIAQVPIYYNHKSTGRPQKPSKGYTSCYMDIDYLPAYPFGYGLSYASFSYSNLKLSKSEMTQNETVQFSVDVTNESNLDGEEVVQLYVHDRFASVTRPVKELKGFQKVLIPAGKTQTVSFTISSKELGFYNNEGKFIAEPGDFDILAGTNSAQTQSISLKLK